MAAGFRGLLELLLGWRAQRTVHPWDMTWRDAAGDRVAGLVAIGATAGAVVTHASPGNALSTGYQWVGTLYCTGTALQWKAPGSTTFGPAIDVSAGGTFHLVDSTRLEAWIEVEVYPDLLAPETARVLLQDRYGTETSGDDVSAGEATAGDVAEWTLQVANASKVDLADVAVWIDPDADHLEVSLDGVTYSAPTTQETGLVIASLGAESAETVYVRRTVSAGAAASPYELACLHAAKDSFGAVGRGIWRIWNAPEYRFYWSDSAPPTEGSTPDATAAALPFTPETAFTDGTWYLAASYFNGVLDSGFLPQGAAGLPYRLLEIQSGVQLLDPPYAPDWELNQTAGRARITAAYFQTGDLRASEWSIAYTVDGSDPTAGSPTATEAITGVVLVYDLPAIEHGTTVKILLQVRRNDGTEAEPAWRYSPAGAIQSLTIDLVGPTAPLGADAWRGRIPAQ